MDEREMTTQENAEERTGGTAPDAGEQEKDAEESFEALIRGKYKEEFDARVRRILDGRLRGLRQENERLRQAAAEAEIVGRRQQEEQLRCAMEFAVRRARQQLVQSIASGLESESEDLKALYAQERRTAQERQPVGPQRVERRGAGRHTEAGAERGEDPILRKTPRKRRGGLPAAQEEHLKMRKEKGIWR